MMQRGPTWPRPAEKTESRGTRVEDYSCGRRKQPRMMKRRRIMMMMAVNE